MALEATGVPHEILDEPVRWSEDFGVFADCSQIAYFFLGSGEDHAQLHNPDYDFPDALLPTGVAIYARIVRHILG